MNPNLATSQYSHETLIKGLRQLYQCNDSITYFISYEGRNYGNHKCTIKLNNISGKAITRDKPEGNVDL